MHFGDELATAAPVSFRLKNSLKWKLLLLYQQSPIYAAHDPKISQKWYVPFCSWRLILAIFPERK